MWRRANLDEVSCAKEKEAVDKTAHVEKNVGTVAGSCGTTEELRSITAHPLPQGSRKPDCE